MNKERKIILGTIIAILLLGLVWGFCEDRNNQKVYVTKHTDITDTVPYKPSESIMISRRIVQTIETGQITQIEEPAEFALIEQPVKTHEHPKKSSVKAAAATPKPVVKATAKPVQATPSPEVVEDSNSSSTLSNEDLYLLERLVSAEADGEPVEGKIAVANVVLNRIDSDQFPNTIKAVIYEKDQFTPASDGTLAAAKPSAEVKEAVKRALDGEQVVPKSVLYFYNPDKAKSTFHESLGIYTVIGNHVFA